MMDNTYPTCKHSRLINYKCDHCIFILPHRLQTGSERLCGRAGCSAKDLVDDFIVSVVTNTQFLRLLTFIAVTGNSRTAVSMESKFCYSH